jgi:uncharacterized membrane protein
MTLKNKNPAKQYIKALKKHLIIPLINKKDFLDGLTQELQEYIIAQPNCTYSALETAFGNPQIVADQFIENSNLSEVLGKSKRKRLIAYIGIIALAIIIICLGIMIHVILGANQVHVTQTITQQPTSSISK